VTASPADEQPAAEVIDGEVIEGEVVSAEVIADDGMELPDDPEAATEVLLGMLAEERQAAQAIFSDLQRVAAEFDNYRKRVQRDQTDLVDRASERVVLELLAVLDSFQAAFTHEPQSPTEENLIAGMRNTYDQLVSVLTKEGLEAIPAIGEPFDPNVHEAAQAPADAGAHLVVSEELRRGYVLRGRMIRPSLVVVDHA
jgi:molecular chaperone GrpE